MQQNTTDVHSKGQKVGTSSQWSYVPKDEQFKADAHCIKTYGRALCCQALNMGIAILIQGQVRDSGGLTYDIVTLALCLRIGVNWEAAYMFVQNGDSNVKQFAKTNQLDGDHIEYAREILAMERPVLEAA